MKISYLILAHKNPKQFHRLVKKLNSENVYFFVHVDKSTDDTPFKKPFEKSDNIFFLNESKRMVSPWSDITISKVILTLLKETVEKFNSKNYCVLLSGQDYPIKSNEYIYSFFQSNYGKNFIEVNDIKDIWPEWEDRFERYNFHLPNKRVNKGIYPLKDKRFFNIRNFKHAFYLIKNVGPKTTLQTIFKTKRKHPDYLIPMGGGTWWALPAETVLEILNFMEEHPDLLHYHTYTHVPDETIFNSLTKHLNESSEIEVTTTYTNWNQKDADSPVTFGKNDLEELLNAGENFLLARKFDVNFDTDILDLLDHHTNSDY